jgi:dihydroflavonol-4-reductase
VSGRPVTVVTGACGHLGANLVRALLERGRTVRVLVREDLRALEGLPVERVEGNVLDLEALYRLVDGAEVVYHLAARVSIAGAEGGRVERINVEGPRRVVQACLERRVRRLVHFSSIHAFSTRPADRVIDETRALALGRGEQPYDRSKAGGQLEVLRGVERGLDAVIVNPGAVIGPHDYKPSLMGRVLLDIYHRRLPALIDGGYNWVDARDVAAGALAAEEKGRAGECYLLTGHWVHICDVSRLVGRLAGRRTPCAAVPLWLAGPASGLFLAGSRLAGRTPWYTPAAVRAVRSHRLISHGKASRELGYSPRPFEETVRDTLEWFRRAGRLAAGRRP